MQILHVHFPSTGAFGNHACVCACDYRAGETHKEPALGDTSSCEAEYRAMPPANITQALKILTCSTVSPTDMHRNRHISTSQLQPKLQGRPNCPFVTQ
jgi:hypothetical protein